MEGGGEAGGRTNVTVREEAVRREEGRREGEDIGGSRDEKGREGWRVKKGGEREGGRRREGRRREGGGGSELEGRKEGGGRMEEGRGEGGGMEEGRQEDLGRTKVT